MLSPFISAAQKTYASAPMSSTTSTRAGMPSPATSSDSGRSPRTRLSPPTELGTGTETPPNETEPFEPSGTEQRFIAGEPMKPATKTFAGRS